MAKGQVGSHRPARPRLVTILLVSVFDNLVFRPNAEVGRSIADEGTWVEIWCWRGKGDGSARTGQNSSLVAKGVGSVDGSCLRVRLPSDVLP